MKDSSFIESGFPCHQVGAETQRERGTSSALPPLYFLHVWWARRPLTPSRAAILASLLPADTDPERFLRRLGIEKQVIEISGRVWTLTGKILGMISTSENGTKELFVDDKVLRMLVKENLRRATNRETIAQLKEADSSLANDRVLMRWEAESRSIPEPFPKEGDIFPVMMVVGDPAWGHWFSLT